MLKGAIFVITKYQKIASKNENDQNNIWSHFYGILIKTELHFNPNIELWSKIRCVTDFKWKISLKINLAKEIKKISLQEYPEEENI